MKNDCCLNPALPNMSKMTLAAVYMFAANIDTIIPYGKFIDITPACDLIENIRPMIVRLRPIMRPYGLDIVSVRNRGYKCVRVEEEEKTHE